MMKRLIKGTVVALGTVTLTVAALYAVMVGVMFAVMPKLEEIEEDDYDGSWFDEDLDD